MNEQSFGPQLNSEGASFRLWAPAAKRVDVLLETPHPLRRGDDGWFSARLAGVKAGTRYKFRIAGALRVGADARGRKPS
jgi:maltooligosyltrehalose trehalohydrolase